MTVPLLFFHLILISSLHCQSFLRISGITKISNKKITFQCKIFIVPEEGWFGQPKYSTHIKTFLRCAGFCLYFLHFIYVKQVRSPLIQRTAAGSSFQLLAFLQPLLLLVDTGSLLSALVNVFHPDWLVRSNFRLGRSDNLHQDQPRSQGLSSSCPLRSHFSRTLESDSR